MIQPSTSDNGLSLLLIEAGLTIIAISIAFLSPRLANRRFARMEQGFRHLARRKVLSVAVVGITMLVTRLAILPLVPIPHPFTTDDFSFLLAADTFAHGRLTNPTPAMWTHFESMHITMQPTYMSMYFPAPGLMLAAGKLLFGQPWFAVLITCALTCAAICWMLQAWLPPSWALLGGMLAVLRIGLFSYWANTYTGGATLSALGGALVLGALPRLLKGARFRYAMLMAVGIVLLATTRPYEGFLVCLPVAAVLGHWLLFGKNRPTVAVLLRRAAAPLALIIAAGAFMGYYDYRAFGRPLTLPYTISRSTYAVVPYYIWQPPRPVPNYRHNEMRRFYTETETVSFKRMRTPSSFLPQNLSKIVTTLMFFAGAALLPPLIMLGRAFRDRRIRLLLWFTPVWIAGMGIGIFLIPHYMAPFTAAAYAIGLQAMRHLRQWRPEGKPVGLTLVRLLVVLCIGMAGLRLGAEPLHLVPTQYPIGPWLWTWVGPGAFGADRANVVAQFEGLPGKHLIFVRYSPKHDPCDEWVYNAADVDGSKVIWAREMDAKSDDELIRYYHDRDVWLVQPDLQQGRVSPYPESANLVGSRR